MASLQSYQLIVQNHHDDSDAIASVSDFDVQKYKFCHCYYPPLSFNFSSYFIMFHLATSTSAPNEFTKCPKAHL